MKLVIFAGGTGTRLWPLSRRAVPKQEQTFTNSQTLIQQTFQRIRRGWPAKDILVSTTKTYAPSLRRQLPALSTRQFIVEPERRENAAAIGLVAARLRKKNPHDVMATVWADHFVKEADRFVSAFKAAENVVRQHPARTVRIGIRPKYADSGLGYLQMGKQIEGPAGVEVFAVKRFVEKPSLKKAQQFVTQWEYLWNPAWSVFRVDAMLEKYRRWMPQSHRLLRSMARTFGTGREKITVNRLYPKLQKISVEYGIMERDKTMLVVPTDVTWLDIGNWQAVYEMLTSRSAENVTRGATVTVDSRRNLLFSYSKRTIATVGLRNTIVVDMPDAVLVCSMDSAQGVKKIVEELERRNREDLL